MALGRVIVDELNLEPSVDTLGRWMAHHISELIRAAETAPSENDRRRLESQAAETISKLWAHRSSFENRINPLFDLMPVIDVIRTLGPRSNPWMINSSAQSQIYDSFRRLVICMIILRVKEISLTDKLNIPDKAAEFLSEEEIEIRKTLETWIAVCRKSNDVTTSKREHADPQDEEDLKRICLEIIDDAKRALEHFREQLV